ncbi:T6SS phospholipase effector Tle1-like catalytic domain-containing protein [Bradyrhizobium sp. LMG 9283]|uniref:T6SS phospholipase effector Tle1-like catalytic domain-containing protein n=1 Tax=Bradyrhizobium sp. LMG 9283 TaxID=592064 RepID=UPI00388DB7D7
MADARPKNIILLLDGTWNDADSGDANTNIVRLRELIARETGPTTSNVVLYQRGVGTGFLDRLNGGAFGAGLAQNVRNAYRFLCANFQPGDRTFVFGFSRGAYTARSLAGLVGLVGIIKADRLNAQTESRAWAYYKTGPVARLSGVGQEIKQDVHQIERPLFECLAVFDTVGSLGIPFQVFWRFNRELYQFHDVTLSDVAKVNLQALAIDEHRWPFEATPWRRSKFEALANITEQCWFAGCHSDVGGGNVDIGARGTRSSPIIQLDDLPLRWMLQRIKKLCKGFPVLPSLVDHRPGAVAAQVEARRRSYRLYPFSYRSIANCEVAHLTGWNVNVGRDRYGTPDNERVHISVLERYGKTVQMGQRRERYFPLNLYAALNMNRSFPVVDWNGDLVPNPQAYIDQAVNLV